jgi:hypothetical protein
VHASSAAAQHISASATALDSSVLELTCLIPDCAGDSAGNNRLPGIMALGYIAAFRCAFVLCDPLRQLPVLGCSNCAVCAHVHAHALRGGGGASPSRALPGTAKAFGMARKTAAMFPVHGLRATFSQAKQGLM